MVRFEAVSFGYEGKQTIKDVSFQINKGDFAAIIGANGAGKTTLSKLSNGILKPTSGRVLVKDKDTKTTRTSEMARTIGFLFQNPDRQICQNTIAGEILFGLKCVLQDEREIESRLNKTLETFGFDGSSDPFSMSRGERQRIALASVLAIQPEILVLDEPTTGLDYRECMHIMELIQGLNSRGTTVMMVTHDMEIVNDFASRVLVVGGGKLLADGDKSSVFKNTEVMRAASLMPPQISALAHRLGGNFEGIHHVSEMADRIQNLKGGGCA